MAGEPDFNPIFRIYPVGVEFTAEYTESSYTKSFTNEDCTVVTDSNGIECYQYQIGTDNLGSLVITAYGKEYSIGTYFGGPRYWNMSLNLYAWTGLFYGTTFYTNTETPGSTLMIFNEDGNDVKLTSSNYIVYMKSKNRQVRKNAFEAMYNYYKSLKNTLAASYVGEIKESAFSTNVKKYNSTIERSLFNDNIELNVYLKKRGEFDKLSDLVDFGNKLEKACIDTLNSGVMTKDLVGLVKEGTKTTTVNSLEFIKEIRKNLEARL